MRNRKRVSILSGLAAGALVAICVGSGSVSEPARGAEADSTHHDLQVPGAVEAGSGPGAISEPLDAETAVRLGLLRNPQVGAGAAGADAAGATYRSIAAFPSVNIAVTHVRESSAGPTLNGATTDTFFDVGNAIDTSGQRRFQAASARSQFSAAQQQLDETRLSLAQQIRDAYWGLVAARAQTQVAIENLRDVQQVNHLTQIQFDVGAAPQLDTVRSGIDVANAEQSQISTQAAERSALAALNALLVQPPLEPIHLADTIGTDTAVTVAAQPAPELPALRQSARDNRPLLKVAREQVRAADYTLKQARASRLPDVTLDYERSIQNPVQTVLFGARVPLLDLGAVRNSIHAAELLKKQAELQEQVAEQQVGLQTAQAYSDYQQAQALVIRYPQGILAPSTTLLAKAQIAYQAGKTGILPVLDAESALRQARTGYVAALLSLFKAQDELRAATGSDALLEPVLHP